MWKTLHKGKTTFTRSCNLQYPEIMLYFTVFTIILPLKEGTADSFVVCSSGRTHTSHHCIYRTTLGIGGTR